MDTITTLTEYPNQLHTLVLEDNNTAEIRLQYFARMQAWYLDLTFENTTINGLKVVLYPNLLRQFRKYLPFGLMVYTDNELVEPFEIEAFSSGRVKIGILNSDEVEEIETDIYNG